LSTYFGNDNSSYQQPGGYYYQPYIDNGPYAQRLKEIGGVAGETAVGAAGLEVGGRPGAVIGALLGHFAGGSAGEAAGFYIDNMSRISENVNTLFNEVNSRSSWIMPSPFGE
jgi:hypothetical protein